MRKIIRRLLILFVYVSILPYASLHGASSKTLPLRYRSWIDEDVPYIITQGERDQFLHLTTDEQRDHFIEEFWETRNPIPHSSINTFKEEHYRRLAYVREHFGDPRYNDGWRSDMGRVYITLGPPQQIAKHHQGIATRPVEIWFYQSPSPALPPYFNLVFYKWSEADPYTLYSPRQDGPTRLVTNDVHDDVQALKVIDRSMGPEAAHVMISLIPGEPTHLDNPLPTALSDNLLDEVRNLPEQKLEKERILRQRSAASEQVSANILGGVNSSDLQFVTLRNRAGEMTVSLLLDQHDPDPSLIGTLPNGHLGYRLNLQLRVMAGNKAIYARSESLAGEVSANGAKAGREKAFGAEARLPLVSGTYTVEATLTNLLAHTVIRKTSTLVVPVAQKEALGMSALMMYQDHPVRDMNGQLPFTISEVRFPPRGEQVVNLHVGENLPIAYQIWLPTDRHTQGQTTVHAEYVLAPLSGSGSSEQRMREDEEVDTKDADPAGNLLTGHKLLTTSLPVGAYRLMVKVTQPGRTGAAFSSATIHIRPSDVPVATWTAYGTEQGEMLWQDDLLRGIASQVQGDDTSAEAFYRSALELNPQATEARVRLQQLGGAGKNAKQAPN